MTRRKMPRMVRLFLLVFAITISHLSVSRIDGQERLGFKSSYRLRLPMGGAVSPSGKRYLSPNPNQLTHLFSMLSEKSISQEIDLSEVQAELIDNFVLDAEARAGALLRSQKKVGDAFSDQIFQELEAMLEEVLLPTQIERLKQLTYHVEISRGGYAHALTEGRFGSEIGVYEGQEADLIQKVTRIEQELNDEVLMLRAKSLQQILSCLTEQQQVLAKQIIGEPFSYDNRDLYTKSRLKMIKAAKESK